MAFHSLRDTFLYGTDTLDKTRGKVFGLTLESSMVMQQYYSGNKFFGGDYMLNQNMMMQGNYYNQMYSNYQPQGYGDGQQYFYNQGHAMDQAAAMYYQQQLRAGMDYMGMNKGIKAGVMPMMGQTYEN